MIARIIFILSLSFTLAEVAENKLDINSAIDDLYNFNFEGALEKLELLSLESPKDPLIPFLEISTTWQRSLLSENPESSYEVIYEGIENVIPFYHDMIEKYPQNQNYRLFLGSLYGLKARIDLAQSKWMELVISGAKGFIYIDEARKRDPNLYDVYMPIGTLEYFLCKSSDPLQLIGNLFGLESDCAGAIEKLEIASNRGKFSWVESRNVLSYVYLYLERDYQKALDVTSSLVNDFPGHPFFAYLHAESLVRLKKYKEYDSLALKLESFYIAGPKNQRVECRDKYLYLEALIAFQNADYQRSIELCDEIIDGYEIEFKWILGYAHFIRGRSLELSGNRTRAISDYKTSLLYLEHYPEYQEAEALISSSIPEVLGSTPR